MYIYYIHVTSQPLITTTRGTTHHVRRHSSLPLFHTSCAPPHFPIRTLGQSIVVRALARLGLAGHPGLLALRFANPHICECPPRSSPLRLLPCLALPCLVSLLTSPLLTSPPYLTIPSTSSPLKDATCLFLLRLVDSSTLSGRRFVFPVLWYDKYR
ncbi:hypothetical protein LZ32DRAFT_239752 [Colletotrichum eremochloae]|nr:hypothetical protein LZ32DRAFT_239752 [Colletotrichum eremochloae]